MDGIEISKVLKQYSDKKTETVIKSPALLFSAATWSYIAHSWSGLNDTCKSKYKTRGNG